jgi:hypothetical protein
LVGGSLGDTNSREMKNIYYPNKVKYHREKALKDCIIGMVEESFADNARLFTS